MGPLEVVMSATTRIVALLLVLAAGACSEGGAAGHDAQPRPPAASDGAAATPPPDDAVVAPADDAGVAPADDAAVGDGLTTFTDAAATAICGALFRCCGSSDLEVYFSTYRASELLAAYRDRMPPRATLDEPGCRALVAEMLGVTPFGDWIREAAAGNVTFVPPAFAGCLADLGDAACGEEVTRALFDGTCLGFAAPAGGAEQRAMFRRERGPGASCVPLRDGIGAGFFGTCDPTVSFCCYDDAAHPDRGCTYAFDAAGNPRTGSCATAAGVGQPCSIMPPLVLCQTGLDCDGESGKCVAPVTASLAVGAPCVDQSYNLLGECVNSFCDVLGSGLCAPLGADGASCISGYECRSGSCQGGACGAVTFCLPGAAVADGGLAPSGGYPPEWRRTL